MASLPKLDVKAFRGANLLLPCESSMVELTEVDWPLLADSQRRAKLTLALREALRIRGARGAWEALAEAEDSAPVEYLAKLVALIALGLQTRVGRKVSRYAAFTDPGAPDRTLAAWEHFVPAEGVSAGYRALELLRACTGRLPAKDKLAKLADAAVVAQRERLPDPVADVIMEGMAARGLPWRVFDNQWPMFEVGTGRRRQFLMTSMPDSQSHIDRMVFRNKFLSGAILREAGLPMPRHELVISAEQAVAAAERIGYPVVVKPVDSGRSRGVTVNITDPEAIPAAFAFAREFGSAVLVERFIPGLPYRILILEGEVIAAALRGIPGVTGDGNHSVAELIDQENARRSEENLTLKQPLPLINVPAFAEECDRRLAEQGLQLDGVPAAGQEVWLAHHAQRGRGGLNIDVTAEMHPDHHDLAKQIAEIMRCPMIGVDFITEDIRRSFREAACGINEVNIEPALNLHMRMTRTPRDVVAPLLDSRFPDGDDGRVPLLAVLGPEAAPLEPLCRALERTGQQVGFATRDGGVTIGGVPHLSPVKAERRMESLLFDPRVDAQVFELRGTDFGNGLPFDRCTASLFLPTPGETSNETAREIHLPTAAKLLSELTADSLILPLDSLEFWRKRFGALRSPAILYSEAAAPDPTALAEVLASGHGVVAGRKGAPEILGVYRGEAFDRLFDLGGLASDARRGWVLAAAGLLGLGYPPTAARRWLEEAWRTSG